MTFRENWIDECCANIESRFLKINSNIYKVSRGKKERKKERVRRRSVSKKEKKN